jgi:hypothetical protein
MKTSVLLGSLLVGAAFLGIAAAHSEVYANANACPGGFIGPSAPLQGCLSSTGCDGAGIEGTGINHGGVRYCAGHITPDGNGDSTITVTDDLVAPVAATYCQVIGELSNVCGAPDPLNPGHFIAPRVFFCGQVTINEPIVLGSKTPDQWATGSNWDTGIDVLIFINGVGNGNALSSLGAGNTCGGVYNAGHLGSVNHT